MSTLRVNNITDASGGSSSLSVPGAAKAWVNFNGTGTVAVRTQLNVSSITDNGTGLYTVNLTTALADADYAFQISAKRTDNVGGQVMARYNSTPTTSALQVETSNASASLLDCDRVCVTFFR